jgi:hypothetical protein
MDEPRYIESSVAIRLKLVAAAVATFLVAVAFDRWVSPALKWVATLPPCDSLPWVRFELIVAILVCWLIAFATFNQGRRTLQAGQTPLPGAWVWSRTKVHTGLFVKVVAVSSFSLSALFLLGPIVLVATQELYVIFCFREACGC